MDGSEYHYELYRLDNELYVIRLWLFWLNRNNFKNKNNLMPLRPSDKSKYIDWFSNLRFLDFPDFERFDLVIGVDNKILLVGTDFNWQEYWYAIDKGIPQVDLSIRGYAFPIGETIERLIGRLGTVVNNAFLQDYEPIFTNLLNRSRATNHSMPYKLPQNNTIESKQIIHSEPVMRGQNLIRSHVPCCGRGKLCMK